MHLEAGEVPFCLSGLRGRRAPFLPLLTIKVSDKKTAGPAVIDKWQPSRARRLPGLTDGNSQNSGELNVE